MNDGTFQKYSDLRKESSGDEVGSLEKCWDSWDKNFMPFA